MYEWIKEGVVNYEQQFLPQGYADADFANDPSRFSRSGLVVMFANAAISWQSTRQQMITCSSSEAELVALNELAKEMAWIRQMMNGFGIKYKTPLRIWQDNMSTEAIAKDITNTKRTKHLDNRAKFINKCVERKWFDIKHIDTAQMVADIFTKPLGPQSFINHRNSLGLVSQSTLEL
jgi:hypothetical protein